MEYVIETRGLRKVYRGGIEALKAVDLRVKKGCCFGLLGPNGAGKSTLVKTLLSIVRATAGDATLLGKSFRETGARRSIGYLPEGHAFPSYLTGRGVCRYFGKLAGLHGPALETDIDAKLELVGMSEWHKTKISKYSKGMKQRVGLAQALLGNPQLVFLDEPTDGVDPVGRQEIREVIRTAAGQGQTIFLNSHLLAEVEKTCDEVAILHKGQLIQQGTVDEVTASVSQGVEGLAVVFTTSTVDDATWSGLGKHDATRLEGGRFQLRLAGQADISGVIDELRAAKVDIYAIEPAKVTLEDAFFKALAGGNGEEPKS